MRAPICFFFSWISYIFVPSPYLAKIFLPFLCNARRSDFLLLWSSRKRGWKRWRRWRRGREGGRCFRYLWIIKQSENSSHFCFKEKKLKTIRTLTRLPTYLPKSKPMFWSVKTSEHHYVWILNITPHPGNQNVGSRYKRKNCGNARRTAHSSQLTVHSSQLTVHSSLHIPICFEQYDGISFPTSPILDWF